METIELTQREIEIILALIYSGRPEYPRIGNKSVEMSFIDDLKPLADKFEKIYKPE